MTTSVSPWVDRFHKLVDPEIIKVRSTVPAQPLIALGRSPVESACDLFKAELDRIFVPTTSAVKLLVVLMERAASYASAHYQDERNFLNRCYSRELDVSESAPFCLTGLAGVGKSQIRKAFFRILPDDSHVKVTSHGEFPLSAGRLVVVKSRKSVVEVLRSLARPGVNEKSLRGESAWLKECQQWLYQCGVCTVGLDELQFLTQSERANTLVAQFLMAMSYLGPPVFFTCNYSLGHRLMKRHQEERQRLLTRIHVLHPDDSDSENWRLVLQEFQTAAPDVFLFNFVEEARQLWNLTAGIKRCLAQLLVLAYRHVRRNSVYSVSISDLLAAYHSIEFCVQRQDVELLFTHGIRDIKGRPDLSCPFQISSAEAEKYIHGLQTARREKVANAVVRSVMTKKERLSLDAFQAAVAPKIGSRESKNIHKLKITTTKTLDSLKLAAEEFKKGLP